MRPDEPLLDLAVEGTRARARSRVPADLRYFDGHFPGAPVVPGFVWVDWAFRVARRHLGCDAAPSCLEALKFHRGLGPGDAFALEVAWESDRLRFVAESEGEPVASGRARFGRWTAPASTESGVVPASEWPLRLPHQGAMRLLDGVVAHEAATTCCVATLREEMPLCADGRAPGWLAIELLAQGMAAAGGLRDPDDAAPARGFLAGARRLTLRTEAFALGQPHWVRAEHLRGDRGLVAFDCALGRGPVPVDRGSAHANALAHGMLTAFVESG